ncbi:hypothetical protein LCGC14_2587670 [marine sediment metagenome]|uniref:Terminase large subunit gp17-like C-terminal domain-containing protein n=1 Tax=marine sediment metagenome TaxID=412755 RepID=A0A0F9CNQ0_9ZZZZ
MTDFSSIEEALKAPKTRLVFDSTALGDCYVYKKEIETPEIDLHGGMVKIWVLPVVGERYVVYSDPSDGKDDPHACGVLHTRTGQIVATSHGKITADVCARIHDSLVRLYNNAYNSYEINATAGGKFAESIETLDTPNRQGFRKGKPVVKDKGWWTGGPVKKDMIWGLEEAIRSRLLIFYDKEMFAELGELIVPEGEDPQVRSGVHDDYIMMLGGLWQIKKYCPLGIRKVISFPAKQEW